MTGTNAANGSSRFIFHTVGESKPGELTVPHELVVPEKLKRVVSGHRSEQMESVDIYIGHDDGFAIYVPEGQRIEPGSVYRATGQVLVPGGVTAPTAKYEIGEG